MSGHQFCRELCLERGEPLAGTGDAPKRMLMLTWPRGKWRAPRWESVGLSDALSAVLGAAAKAGLHVALVDRVGETDSLPQLHALPESIFTSFDSEDELIAAIQGFIEGRIFAGQHDPRTTILCCTDSRRDACCARYGFSTYKALDAVADRQHFNIVQATHLGGCRFAASLVVMPHRQRYGRMTAGLVPAFLESLSRKEVFLPAYKGRTDQPEPMQVAELAALKWAFENTPNIRDVHVQAVDLTDKPVAGSRANFCADVGPVSLNICLKARNFRVQGNCDAVAQGEGDYVLRWCFDHLRLVENKEKVDI